MKIKRIVLLVLASVLLLFGCQSGQTEESLSIESDKVEQDENKDIPGEEKTQEVEKEKEEKDQKSVEESAPQEKVEVPEKDKKIPAYELSLNNGKTVKLDSFKDKVVIVSFFTTWCTYCKKELPVLEKYANEIDDLVVIGVNVKETEDELKSFLDEQGITFPIYRDEDGSFARKFYVSGFPTSVFIAPEGILVGSVPGYVEEEKLKEYIEYSRNYKPENKEE